MNAKTITARMRFDGMVVEVLEDGSERPFPETTLPSMTNEEIETAARNDPDAQPLSNETLKRMQRIPRAKIIRRALGLTQEEFAARFHIPLAELCEWEQGSKQPDQLARAYLAVIACDSESVEKALRG